MALVILVNTGSGNYLLPDSTKPLPEPKLIYLYQCGPVTITRGQVHKRYQPSITKNSLEINYLKFFKFPKGQWVYPTKWNFLHCYQADSRFAPSQWETALLCNDVSHWLGANLETALLLYVLTHLLQFMCSHSKAEFDSYTLHKYQKQNIILIYLWKKLTTNRFLKKIYDF